MNNDIWFLVRAAWMKIKIRTSDEVVMDVEMHVEERLIDQVWRQVWREVHSAASVK